MNYKDSGELSIIGARGEIEAISSYSWSGPKQLKEAIKVFLSAHLEENEVQETVFGRFTPKERQEVELRLAANPATSARVLDYIARRSDCVRTLERIAGNPMTPTRTLFRLASHESSAVRCALAERDDLEEDLLWHLAVDLDPDVRYRLAEGLSLPKLLLQALTTDDNPFVAVRAHQSLKRVSGSRFVEGQFGTSSGRLRVVS